MSRSGSYSTPRPPAVAGAFDPKLPDSELFDTLAEKEADRLGGGGEINSSSLRRFFGEIKELYRRFESQTAAKSPEEREAYYRASIEPLFKMVRSKVAYASRPGGQSTLHQGFGDLLSSGIAKTNNSGEFRRFVLHLEAVVGFMYGKGVVKK
jgi:CRISPR type III-A-associated protein Csm2